MLHISKCIAQENVTLTQNAHAQTTTQTYATHTHTGITTTQRQRTQNTRQHTRYAKPFLYYLYQGRGGRLAGRPRPIGRRERAADARDGRLRGFPPGGEGDARQRTPGTLVHAEEYYLRRLTTIGTK